MSLTINGTTNTLTAASGLTVAGNTAITGTLSATGQTNLDAGTVAAPGLVLEGETGTGLYRIGANNHGYAIAGVNLLDIASGALTVTGSVVANSLAVSYSVPGGASTVTNTNPDVGATSIATYRMKTGASANVWHMFTRNNTLNWGIDGLADYATLSSTALTLGTDVRLGVGVSPSAWSSVGIQALQVSNGSLAGNTASAWLNNNSYFTGAYQNTYIANGAAQQIGLNRGGGDDIIFLVAPAGTAGNPISFTTVATMTGTALTLGTGVNLVMAPSYIEGAEMTAPAAPAANGFRIFAEDNGAGKTRLMVQFATGAAQQIAIEP